MRLLLLALLVLVFGCGGSPSGPTRAWPPPPTFEDGYVAAVVRITDGVPLHWAGGAFSHCRGVGIDPAVVERAAAEMTRLTGLSRSSGACNVEWAIDPLLVAETPFYGKTIAYGTETEIFKARITFKDVASLHAMVGHEVGHALGLFHSPRPDDMMHPIIPGGRDPFDYSPREAAIFAWMYGR